MMLQSQKMSRKQFLCITYVILHNRLENQKWRQKKIDDIETR